MSRIASRLCASAAVEVCTKSIGKVKVGSTLLAATLAAVTFTSSSVAQVNLGPITVGAGIRTGFVHNNVEDGSSTNRFPLDNMRLYVNGPVTQKIKFMFNTDYNTGTNEVQVLDAVARLEVAPQFNVWAGRFLPPSDRANLAGPFFNNHWGVYSDGIQNGHPFIYQGRDNGIVYWGDFAKRIKVSVG